MKHLCVFLSPVRERHRDTHQLTWKSLRFIIFVVFLFQLDPHQHDGPFVCVCSAVVPGQRNLPLYVWLLRGQPCRKSAADQGSGSGPCGTSSYPAGCFWCPLMRDLSSCPSGQDNKVNEVSKPGRNLCCFDIWCLICWLLTHSQSVTVDTNSVVVGLNAAANLLVFLVFCQTYLPQHCKCFTVRPENNTAHIHPPKY